MDLKQALVKEFAKTMTPEKEENKDGSQLRGTIQIRPDGKYVHLDGAPDDILTPITEGLDEETGSSFIQGDRVLVLVKDHQVIFTKNLSVNSHAAESAMEEASEASRAAGLAQDAANTAVIAAASAQESADNALEAAEVAQGAADSAKESAEQAILDAATAQAAADQAIADAKEASDSAASAGVAASIAQSAVEATVKEYQIIYFTGTSESETPEIPNDKVTTTEDLHGAWTTIVPSWNDNYPYYWEATQYNTVQILGEESDPPFTYIWTTGQPHRNFYLEDGRKTGANIEDFSQYFYHDSSGAHIVSDKQDGKFRVDITSEELSFMENNVKVAYVNGQRLYISETVVLNEMQVGNNKWSWKYDESDDSFYLKWIGGNV